MGFKSGALGKTVFALCSLVDLVDYETLKAIKEKKKTLSSSHLLCDGFRGKLRCDLPSKIHFFSVSFIPNKEFSKKLKETFCDEGLSFAEYFASHLTFDCH